MLSSGWQRLPVPLILAVGLLCYANSFSVPFVLDDVSSILSNPAIRVPTFAIKPRLLGELSFALNYALHGFALSGYHLVNLGLHLFNAILVYLLVLLLFRTPQMNGFADNESGRSIAVATALLFVAHPLQTAAVTYLAQRVTLLAAFFYLGALFLYLKSRLSRRDTLSMVYLILSMGSAAAALFSKENAVTIPLVMVLCECTFFSGGWRKRLALCGLFFVPIVGGIVLTNSSVLLQSDMSAAIMQITAERGAPTRLSYLLTQFPVLLDYLRLLFVPIGQNLDHDVPLRSSCSDPVVIGSFLALLVFTVVAFLFWMKGRKCTDFLNKMFLLAGFGIAWFFVSISLESGLVPIRDLLFEHRVYLPSIGIFLAFASLLWLVIAKVSRAGRGWRYYIAAVVIMVTALALLTISRNRVWRSEVTLWEDAVSKSRAKGRTHGALGHAYQRAGMLDKAETAYLEAVRLAPKDHIARNNLGAVYVKQRRFNQAVSELKEAVLLSPSTAEIYFNLGLAYAGLGLLNDAAASFSEAVRLKPDYRNAQENLTILQKAMAH